MVVFGFVSLFNNIANTKQVIAQEQKATILFIPGLNLQGKDYQTLLTKLGNDHYRVIVYVPRDTNVSDYQTIVREWTKGIGEQIGNKKVIVIGHSIGGSVAAYFCAIDTRCVAGVNMDGAAAFDKKIPVPFLYLQADMGSYCDTQCVTGRSLMEKVAIQSRSSFIHIVGIKHYNFTDLRTQQLRNEDYLGPQDGREFVYANIKAFLKKIH